MQTLLCLIQDKFNDAIKKTFFGALNEDELQGEIAFCIDQKFGNYQCNSALKLTKLLKESPRAIAEKIIANLNEEKIFSKIEIAGPGFINVTLDSSFLSSELNKACLDTHLGVHCPEHKRRVIVEFSSPNVAKQLHVGHLRSTIIGDCIARFFEFLDDDVLRLNHIGDWGTQFGMLIAYMKQYEPDVLKGKKKTNLVSLEHWYKESKKKFDEDEDFKKRAHSEVVNLQGGEEEALHAWKIICAISREAYQEIYDLLDVKLNERGESYYNPVLGKVVKDLDEKGLVTISDGAKCIFSDEFKNREGNPLPLMIQKSDGGYNYDTTDMAAMRQRALEEKAEIIVVVTDIGQSTHFKMIYAASVKAGYIDPKKTRFDHVTFGLVLAPDGKKFKTRSGETEKLIDLLHGAVDCAKTILKEREADLPDEELNNLAQIIGVGAIKYADLSCHRQKDYHFSYERMLKFEGNTAVFLLYSYVRVMGIKRKVENVDELIKDSKINLQHPAELTLGVHLRRFGEILEVLERELLPNRLTDYLYELAEKFNAFFRDCRVVGSPEQKSRLVLCDLTAKILKQGLNILGLKTADRL